MLARAIAGSIDGATTRASSARPTCSRPTSRDFRSSTRRARVRVSGRSRLRERRARRRDQPRDAEDAVGLLEAMAETQVTIDGSSRPLPDPFLVLATENPIEQEGTFPLPEAQLDRFFMRTALGYPNGTTSFTSSRRSCAHTRSDAAAGRRSRRRPRAAARGRGGLPRPRDPPLDGSACAGDARGRGVAIGASVRGSLALERGVRAWALLDGRDYVTRSTSSGSSCRSRCTGSSSPRASSPLLRDRLERRRCGASASSASRSHRDPVGARRTSRTRRVTASFPLIPRRRVLGLAFGGLRSVRRGAGSDVAASRPYRPGDDVSRSTGPRRPASRRAGRTSSSSASTSPSAPVVLARATGGRRCAPFGEPCRGSTRLWRCARPRA